MKHLINFTLFLIIIFVVGCNSYEFVPPEKQTTAKNIEGLKKYFYENTSGYVYIPNSEINKSANLYSNSIKLYPKERMLGPLTTLTVITNSAELWCLMI